MIPRTPYISYLAGTLDYRESEPIEPSHLEALVTRLRGGDRTVAAAIIKGHYRLVAAIVGARVHSKKQHDDCLGAALLALTQAVDDSAPQPDPDAPPDGTLPGALYDNNITWYITTTVKYAIRDEIASAHVVRVPGRTVRKRISEGFAFGDVVPSSTMEIKEDVSSDGDWDGELVGRRGRPSSPGFSLPFHIPASRPLCESPEFKEALARAVSGPLQQAIITLRAQGYSYKEVGDKVGMSHQRVGQIMAEIEPRFDAYFRT